MEMELSNLHPKSYSDSDANDIAPNEIFQWQPLPDNAGTLQNMTVAKVDDQNSYNWEKLREEELENLQKFMEQSNETIRAENDLLENYLAAMDPALIENMDSILEAATAAIHKAERTQQLGMMASVTSRSQTSGRGGQESSTTTPRSSQTQTGGSSKVAAFALSDKGPKIQPTQKMEIIQREMDCLKASFEEDKGKVDKNTFFLQCQMAALSARLREITTLKTHFDDCVSKDWVDEGSRTIAGEKIIQHLEHRNRSDAMQIKALQTKRKNLKIQFEATNLKLKELGDELKYVDYEKLKILDREARKNLEATTKKLNETKKTNSMNISLLSQARSQTLYKMRQAETQENVANMAEAKIGKLLTDEVTAKDEITRRQENIDKFVEMHRKYEAPSVMSYVKSKDHLQNVRKTLEVAERRAKLQEKQLETEPFCT